MVLSGIVKCKKQVVHDFIYSKQTERWGEGEQKLVLFSRSNGEPVFNRYKRSVWNGKNALEMDTEEITTTRYMSKMPLNILKNRPTGNLDIIKEVIQ